MSEMTQPQVEPAAETPEADLPDNWEELFGDNPPKAEPEQPAPEDSPPEKEKSEESELAEKEAELRQWRDFGARYAREMQAKQQSGQAVPADPIAAALEQVKKEYSGVDENVLTFLGDVLKKVLPAVNAPVVNEVKTLKQSQESLRSKGVLEEFDKHLTSLFDAKDVPQSLRRQFKNDIYMEGWQRYGNRYDEAKASRLFQEAYGAFVEEKVTKDGEYVDSKLDKENNSPPPTHRGNGGHAVEDVHKQIIKSGDRKNDFGGQNWKTMIRKKLGRQAQ